MALKKAYSTPLYILILKKKINCSESKSDCLPGMEEHTTHFWSRVIIIFVEKFLWTQIQDASRDYLLKSLIWQKMISLEILSQSQLLASGSLWSS